MHKRVRSREQMERVRLCVAHSRRRELQCQGSYVCVGPTNERAKDSNIGQRWRWLISQQPRATLKHRDVREVVWTHEAVVWLDLEVVVQLQEQVIGLAWLCRGDVTKADIHPMVNLERVSCREHVALRVWVAPTSLA